MSIFGVQAADIANQSLDAIGWANTITDLQEGSVEARILLRNYAPTVEQTLRAAHWNCARRQAAMMLLQDASGNTEGVGTGTPGMGLWIYSYAWPVDCLKARYVPITGALNPPIPANNIQTPSTPQTSLPSPWPVARTLPAPFLVSSDLVPNVTGALTSWNQYPDLSGVQGQGLSRQTVILTNQQNATLVYTGMVDDPNLWDALLKEAIIQTLAAKVALALWSRKEMKTVIVMRDQAIKGAKAALDAARVADGNEAPANTNHDAQWIRSRRSGGYGWGWGGGDYAGPGYLWCGWEQSPFPDGSAY